MISIIACIRHLIPASHCIDNGWIEISYIHWFPIFFLHYASSLPDGFLSHKWCLKCSWWQVWVLTARLRLGWVDWWSSAWGSQIRIVFETDLADLKWLVEVPPIFETGFHMFRPPTCSVCVLSIHHWEFPTGASWGPKPIILGGSTSVFNWEVGPGSFWWVIVLND